jgi:hypothetical protein
MALVGDAIGENLIKSRHSICDSHEERCVINLIQLTDLATEAIVSFEPCDEIRLLQDYFFIPGNKWQGL